MIGGRHGIGIERKAKIVGSVLGLALTLVILVPSIGGPSSAPSMPSLAAMSGFQCKIVFGSTPSALLIPVKAPANSLSAGDKLSFTYQFRVLNYSSALLHKTILVPSTFAVFPLAAGGTLQIFQLPKKLSVTGSQWSSGSLTTASTVLASSKSFLSGSNATLTTEKLAVMATAGYGVIHIAFRWHWTITFQNGSVLVGTTSAPTSTAFHPSIFYPAPFVSLVRTSGNTTTIGQYFTAYLSGWISNEAFFLELEHPTTGLVVQTRGDTAPPGNSTPFGASILFNSRDYDLAPGPMLVHIHNHCGSMLYSISVKGIYANSSSVRLLTSTALCNSIGFGGKSYSSNTVVHVRPSSTLIKIDAPACTGHKFASWGTTGSIDVTTPTSGSTTVLVTYNGTLKASYT